MKRIILILAMVLGFGAGSVSFAGIQYVGIGVTVQKSNLDFQIIDLRSGGPADRMGVRAGDYLKQVDGQDLMGLSLEQVAGLLQGQVGTPVTLTLFTAGEDSTHEITVYREWVEIDCFMEGSANLNLTGSMTSGWITGWIGSDSVNWNQSWGRISGSFKGESLSLNLSSRPGNLEISGWVHNTYVQWVGWANTPNSGSFNFYQSCIP